MEDIILNGQQDNALIEGKKWWNKGKPKKPTFEISGSPGTGKTTIVAYMIEEFKLSFKDVLFVTFTGRAALNLRLKGSAAKTVHSTLYELIEIPKLDACGKEIIGSGGRIVKTKVFIKREQLPENIKLLVVDEAGMINETMATDMLSFGVPIVCLGDIDQLEPVFGKCGFLQNPDIILTEIMRQHKDNPIIYLSRHCKDGGRLTIGNYGGCRVIDKNSVEDSDLVTQDVIIAGKNITRMDINDYIRHSIYQKKRNTINIDDKIICRKNNWNENIFGDIYLVNGLSGYVKEIYYETYNKISKSVRIDFEPDFLKDEFFDSIELDLSYLFNPTAESRYAFDRWNTANRFEWGWCVTCHVSQGSEFDSVLLFNEYMGTQSFYKKWIYTAITRAKKNLIIAI